MNQESEINFDSILAENNYLVIFKELINEQNQQLSQKFNPDHNVLHLLEEKSTFIDKILIHSWHHFLNKHAQSLCLVATGGYGRNELFPQSDIDILILLQNPDTSTCQDELSAFSNFLWDINLQPGMSVRTISECLTLAAEDQTIMTNLLETRHLTGNLDLFKDLNQKILTEPTWKSAEFFHAKMKEQDERYQKYHDTAYNLEPNIKEGPGGLRDLQNIAWVFKQHYKTQDFNKLVEYNFLYKSEFNDLIQCRNTLFRIRFALHTLTKSTENRLLFDFQRELAQQFGYTYDDKPDVEQFMQFYFKTVMELERMNEMILQLFNEKFFATNDQVELYPINDHFVSVNNYLQIKEDYTFEKHPLAMLEMFSVLQKNKQLKGVRASTIRQARKSLYLIDESYRENPEANQLFLTILRSSRGITHQLRQMNRYGILAAYLPCFANIVARMQYDLYHIYTVDAHTLFVLRNLRRFTLEKHKEELPFCHSVSLKINKPEILYIAAIFHDIAKGKGGDHSVLGETIAQDFCSQHDLSKHDSKLICWLVRNHLIMSMTAQRKDINDPNIIHKFALQVGSIEYLNHLYLLTVADIRATNPSLWNSWKDSLLTELYTLTHSALHRGLQNPMARSERLYENKQEAMEQLINLGISDSTILSTWNLTGDDYFLRYSSEEIAWHTIAIASSDKEDLPLVLLRPQNQKGSVEIFIYAKNEANIFSISAATLEYLGLTILDARIVTITLTRSEQYALNSFQVLEQSGEPIKDLTRELQICQSLRNNLEKKQIKQQSNLHRQSRQAKHFPIRNKILFHKDPLSRYTIIEMITTDHAGLLAKIGKAFNQLELQLHDAKITTIGSRVEDMFYVTDHQLRPIEDEERIEEIKEQLYKTLE